MLHNVLPLEPLPANIDLRALKGLRPWLRLRVGDWRVLLRPLTPAELSSLELVHGLSTKRGYYVEAVVNRRQLGQRLKRLP